MKLNRPRIVVYKNDEFSAALQCSWGKRRAAHLARIGNYRDGRSSLTRIQKNAQSGNFPLAMILSSSIIV